MLNTTSKLYTVIIHHFNFSTDSPNSIKSARYLLEEFFFSFPFGGKKHLYFHPWER